VLRRPHRCDTGLRGCRSRNTSLVLMTHSRTTRGTRARKQTGQDADS
jgi:hypothetical protein